MVSINMTRNDWNVELIDEMGSLVGPSKLKWRCENQKEDIEKTIKTKLQEKKTYPEEDFKYKGEINGKKVEGTFITGHGPMKSVRSVGDKKLSDAERVAGIAHIDWFC